MSLRHHCSHTFPSLARFSAKRILRAYQVATLAWDVGELSDNSVVVTAIITMRISLQHCGVVEGTGESIGVRLLQRHGLQEGDRYLLRKPSSEM